MSEVHLMNRAAVSPSFIKRQTETAQELGTSLCLGPLFLSSVCVSLFLCVASGAKRRSPTSARGRVKHLSLTQQCFSVVLGSATSHVAFAFGVRVFRVVL